MNIFNCLKLLFLGIVHYELLPRNRTINAEVYCAILDRLQLAIAEKRPQKEKIILLHDNARPHVAATVKAKLANFDWEILPHPPYSPDLAPSDYHLFRSLQNFLNGRDYNNDEEIEADLKVFFNSKLQSFYVKGIAKLPDRWQKTINFDGDYFIE